MKKEIRPILLIETSTEACSVALSNGSALIEEIYLEEPKAHASVVAPFVERLLKGNELAACELAAVAVSKGPGSYTGLRVGVSVAKGICYAASVPLIGISTLATIAECALESSGEMVESCNGNLLIVPMIDARRMEVYTATYNREMEEVAPVCAKILEKESYSNQLSESTLLFTGNGAEKFKELLASEGTLSPNALFLKKMPQASGMRRLAAKALEMGKFEDVAYFQPFYLKEFVAGKPKKLLKF